MKITLRIILFIAVVFALVGNNFPSLAQPKITYLADPDKAPREHFVDMQHLLLEVAFVPQEAKVIGTVTHTFSPKRDKVNTLFLDGIRITVKAATLDGKAVNFASSDTGVAFSFSQNLQRDKRYKLKIDYEATPRKGIYFVGWNDPSNISRKQIWTQGQAIDHRHWIPMYDGLNDKAVTEIKISFDKQYQVVSNGKLLGKKSQKENNLWHYKLEQQHATYLMMLAIGNYDMHLMQSASGVQLQQWHYPDHKERVEWTYRYSEEMMDFMEAETGVPYPWGKTYSNVPVQEFMYGAMENTSATIYGDFLTADRRGFTDRNYIGVNTHELAHQWFGDLVTARSAAHHWLQESFATYYPMIFGKQIFGDDYYNWEKRKSANNAIEAGTKDDYPVAHSKGGRARVYPKGAVVLDMLRYVTGDVTFKKAIQYYLQNNAFENATTEDLLAAFHKVSGMSLDWFFDQWLYRGGEPEYTVSYRSITENLKPFTEIEVLQTHKRNETVGLFTMPVWLEVHYKNGSKSREQHWVSKERETIKIANIDNREIAFVLFDADNAILKKLNFKKDVPELLAQAQNATNIMCRYDAMKALEKEQYAAKAYPYSNIFKNAKFHLLRSEVINQIVKALELYPDLAAPTYLIDSALKDNDLQVRKAAVYSLKSINAQQATILESYFTDNNTSYETLIRSLELLVAYNPNNTEKYLNLSKNIKGINGLNFRIKWLETAIDGNINTTKNTEELVSYTSISYDFLTRVGAFESLYRLDILNEEILSNLNQAITSANSRLANPAKGVLEKYRQVNKYKKMVE